MVTFCAKYIRGPLDGEYGYTTTLPLDVLNIIFNKQKTLFEPPFGDLGVT